VHYHVFTVLFIILKVFALNVALHRAVNFVNTRICFSFFTALAVATFHVFLRPALVAVFIILYEILLLQSRFTSAANRDSGPTQRVPAPAAPLAPALANTSSPALRMTVLLSLL